MMKTFSELKALARSQIKGKIGVLFAMFLIMAVVSLASNIVPILGCIVNLITSAAFTLGIACVFLKIVRGEAISVGNVFYGFEDLWTAIKAQFFTGLFFGFGRYF